MCSRCASCPGSVLHAQDVADPRSNQTSTLPSSSSRTTRGTLGSSPLYFCREMCSFLFLVVFSQLEQFNKPLSSFSWHKLILVFCVFLQKCLCFWGLLSVPYKHHSWHPLPCLASPRRAHELCVRPTKRNNKPKNVFSFSWLCSMSTPAHFILIWTFSYDNILGFNVWLRCSCVAFYLSSPL